MIAGNEYVNGNRARSMLDFVAKGDTFHDMMAESHASYMAGQVTRYLPELNGASPLGSGADYHYPTEASYFRMTERARQEDRDNMVLGQALNRLVSNIIRSPFALDVSTGDEEVDKDLSQRWEEWSGDPNQCDFDGERDFHEMTCMKLRTSIVDGDIFAIPTNQDSIQILENHRCRNPFGKRNRLDRGNGIVHGVELQNGRRSRYWFTEDDLRPTAHVTKKTAMKPIAARNPKTGNRQVFQYYPLVKRFTQRRGVTCCAPIMFPLSYHDDLQFANLVNAKVQSFFAMIHEYEKTPQQGSKRQKGSRSEVNGSDGKNQVRESGGPGRQYYAEVGEKLTGFSPNIPASSFFEHAALLLAIVGINLDMPEMMFMLDASKGDPLYIK